MSSLIHRLINLTEKHVIHSVLFLENCICSSVSETWAVWSNYGIMYKVKLSLCFCCVSILAAPQVSLAASSQQCMIFGSHMMALSNEKDRLFADSAHYFQCS